MVVRIFDISAFCHAGIMKNSIIDGPIEQTPGGYIQKDLPASGISYLFNQVAKYYRTDVLMFTADRFPEHKIDMLPEYKQTRHRDIMVSKNKDVAEQILEHCGFPVFHAEGYEADDFEYVLCRELSKLEEVTHVYLYCGDSDLYLTVNDKVSTEPVHSRDKRITRENFEYTVKKGEIVPYNTLTLKKIIEGDVSDNIPPIDKALQPTLYSIMQIEELRDKFGDKEFLGSIIQSFCPDAMPQVDLVFPLEAPIDDVRQYLHPGNKERILMWADAMDHRSFPRYNVRDPEIDIQIDKMVAEGLYIQ